MRTTKSATIWFTRSRHKRIHSPLSIILRKVVQSNDVSVILAPPKLPEWMDGWTGGTPPGPPRSQYLVSIRAVSGARSSHGGGAQHQCQRALGPNISAPGPKAPKSVLEVCGWSSALTLFSLNFSEGNLFLKFPSEFLRRSPFLEISLLEITFF